MAEGSLQWKDSTPGVYTRSLDATETHYTDMRNMYARYGKEWGRLSTIMRLHFATPDFVAAIQQAWKWIRYRHPVLASTISADNTRLYRVANPKEVEEWIAETFVVHDEPQTAQDFLPEVQSVERATLHVFPQTRQLLLVVSHHTMDGHSLLCLINYLLELLNSPPGDVTYGDEAKNLPRPLKLAAHIPDANPSQIAKTQSTINNWFGAFPSLGVGAKDLQAIPETTRVQRMELSVDETSRVIAAAKSKGFSPTHVIEAAVILAAKKLNPSDEDRKFCSCGLFSLRAKCDAEDQESCIPYVTFIPQAITPGSFLDTAQHLKDYYNGWKADVDDLLAMIEPMLGTFAMMKAMPDPPPNEMLSVSSFGMFEPRLESVHGKVALRDFSLIYETPDPGVTSFSWTRGGRITWQVCYNERYHEAERIAMWVKLTKESLFQGMELVPDI